MNKHLMNILKSLTNIVTINVNADEFGEENYRKIILHNIILLLTILYLIIFGVDTLIKGNYIFAVSDFIVVLILIVIYISIRISQRFNILNLIGLSVISLLFYYNIITTGIAFAGFLWTYALPPATLFLLGGKKGALYNAVFLIAVCVFFYFDNDKYTTELKIRYLASYITVFAISYFYEYVRSITQDNLTKKNKEIRNTLQKLTHLAYHDPLTGLENRKAFYEQLELSLLAAQRPQDVVFKAVLFIDLDNFKDINDTMGHAVGDRILQKTASRLKKLLRRIDGIYRIGGDEFTVVLQNMTFEIDAGLVADKIIRKLSKPLEIDGHQIFMSASIGISLYPKDGTDVPTLVKHSDLAMYDAKKEKNRYSFFAKEMNVQSSKRITILNDLRTAFDKHQFVMHYQPIVDKECKIIGLESLVRWEHPDKGLMSPLDFLPIAENSKLMGPLSSIIFELVGHDTKSIENEGYSNLLVTINLSSSQLTDSKATGLLNQIIGNYNLDPNKFIIEILESSVIEDNNEITNIINSFSYKGVCIAIDDFGTGYAALNYIVRFPVRYIKIDRSFVFQLPHNEKYVTLVRAMINFIKTLNLTVIAEGIETKEQHDFLVNAGCDLMQGYYYSRPLKIDDFIKYLKSNTKGNV